MDRYQISESDPYLIKGTDCLKNIKDITDINELEVAEREATKLNIALISEQKSPYSLATMKYIHKTLFSSLYQWAGELRLVGIWKGTTRFCAPERIEAEALKIFQAINLDFQNKEKFWSLEDTADRLAYHYGELNIIHPFREGNGRTQRILFEYIAQDAKYSIRWQEDSDQWISANISAYTTDHKALKEIFMDILEPI
ncbi:MULTISPECIES: Fic family protein [Pseudomonas]|uniref:protein adenylyltransferase n=1 Tax=Pseudomonas baetica TaxID=674054 RepID=A0ABX4PU82_9PSED|nr:MULTISPECIES: Fic family protein [Pseudomonas]MDR9865903.1 Fic family protein [Pseudomonas baetica]PKA68586.1 cell filamentation protein [Pseudomonas baetica]PTC17567.1 cell filamentation protein Fic [Pseudomonas baetica]